MFDYDVALSFAGEDRTYVREIAKRLRAKKLKVFYDEFEEANLLGKDLYQYLHYIYKECALFCVVFVSKNYIKKAWTRVELRAAQNRAFLNSNEYILPLMLEVGVKLPGLSDTIGYIGTYDHTATQIVKIICEKVNASKPAKGEELRIKECTYNVVFETFDFIVTRYSCFGRGSKEIEIGLIKYIISEYKDFLLDHVYELNRDLYDFLVKILKDLTSYIEEGTISFYNSVDLRYKANALNMLRKAFVESGFNTKFDFYYYLDNIDIESKTEEMLKTAIDDIVKDLEKRIDTPITAMDYLEVISRLTCFDSYVVGDDTPTLVEFARLESEMLKDLEEEFDNSPVVEFENDVQ